MYFQRQDRLTARILTVTSEDGRVDFSDVLVRVCLAAKDPKDPDL